MYQYIDIHAHLDMRDFNEDREELTAQLQEEKIGVITIGVDKKSSYETVKLADKYKNIFATIGCHPIDAGEQFQEADFEELIKHPKVVAIGECGLDFFRIKDESKEEKAKQIKLFESQINFAYKHDKPLMIHCREAHTEVLDILKSKKQELGEKLRGNIHFFSGDIVIAKQYLNLDFSFSFGGVITFTDNYDEVIQFLPWEKIMSETDAPFVAPKPYRGQRNSPFYIKEIAKKIAEIKQGDFEEVKKRLVQNAERNFLL